MEASFAVIAPQEIYSFKVNPAFTGEIAI